MRTPGFSRSKWVGIGGLFVVVGLTILIGLKYGQGANPRGAEAAILGIVFAYVFILLAVQRADVRRAAVTDERDAARGRVEIDDPAIVGATELAAAMAVEPVDDGAIAARRGAWGMASFSVNSAIALMVLIAITLVPWQLYQWKWSLIVGVPLIVLYILFLCARLLAGGSGSIERAYALSGEMMRPLGLEMVEHPTLTLTPSLARPSYDTEMRGAMVLEGERHGRGVSVRIQSGADTVTYLRAPVADFSVAAKGERLKAPQGSPPRVAEALESLKASSHWKGVSVTAGDEGITVIRTRDTGSEWLWDLWLAELLAAAGGKSG